MEDKKVSLPKYVVDVLDGIIVSDYTPYGLLTRYEDLTSDNVMSEARLWFGNSDNQWKLLQTLKYGYEVEKEQLYYVVFGDYEPYENEDSFLNLKRSDNSLFTMDNDETIQYKTKFTMDEIKSFGEKYVPFAIKIEEIDGEQ